MVLLEQVLNSYNMGFFREDKDAYKETDRRVHKRTSLSDKISYIVIGSLDVSNCLTDECINAKIHDVTPESIILLTDYRLKPGTFIRLKDLNEQPQTAVIMWSLNHNNLYQSEALFI